MRDVVAVDLGATTIKGARCDASGTVIAELVRATPRGDEAVEAVRKLVAELVGPDTVAVGIASPGPVDEHAGVVRGAVNLGWKDVPLRDILVEDLSLPVALAHDVVAAALAEHAARPHPSLLFVALGTGISASYVLDGVAARGAHLAAGELGHVLVRAGGLPCSCGASGCLETLAAGWGIERASGVAPAEVVARLNEDAMARVWRDATDALGDALGIVTALTDPGVIVLGGGLSAAGDDLLLPVRERVRTALPWRAAPPIELSVLGAAAGRRGAEMLAWRAVGETS